jgi:hypothetical protein
MLRQPLSRVTKSHGREHDCPRVAPISPSAAEKPFRLGFMSVLLRLGVGTMT